MEITNAHILILLHYFSWVFHKWRYQFFLYFETYLTHIMKISSIFEPSTVCWFEVKAAFLCAQQYIPWNVL